MPFEVQMNLVPAGVAASAKRREDPTAEVRCFEFLSTEDGQLLVQRLEGHARHCLNLIPSAQRPRESQIDHMLVIVRSDCSATIYVNELRQVARGRVSRAIKAGEPVMRDDFVDIESVDLGIDIPSDAGFLFMFSSGWRRGLVYDFCPIIGEKVPREFNVNRLLAQALAHVQYQERFSITVDEWKALFDSQWFPFVHLKSATLDRMLSYIRSGWSIDELTSEIVSEVEEFLDDAIVAWRSHPAFADHIDVLTHAAARFKDKDFMSCAGLLYPRIEGILRSLAKISGGPLPPRNQCDAMADRVVAGKVMNPQCLLLPHRFRDYLRRVYFADFNPNDPHVKVSRHSVGHGVASAAEFNDKAAVVGLLIVQQLFYFSERSDDTDGSRYQS